MVLGIRTFQCFDSGRSILMEEPDPNDHPGEDPAEGERRRSRRQPMTPELRKFLGPGRSWREREAAKEEEPKSTESSVQPSGVEPTPPSGAPWPASAEPVRASSQRSKTTPPAPTVVADQKISRALEMQTVVLAVGILILIGAAFYAGTKIRALKAFVSSRKAETANVDTKKYPGLTSDELVEQALAAERLGNWHEAVERLLVAKRRNLLYRGLLFHAGKLCYDHGDFDGADRLLERAIAFGDEVDTANYLRGLIAVGRNDYPTAQQFFEAAITAEPFTPGYYYYLAEALRRELRPKDAVARYEQAASRTVNEQDATLCRLKARIAKAETADRPQLQTEVDQKRGAGPLTADWLLTDAALKIEAGEFGEAAQLIRQARQSDSPQLATLFGSAMSDMLFIEAATKHPEIAEACRLSAGAPVGPSPSPFESPK